MTTSLPALAQTSPAPTEQARAAERLAVARKLHQQQKLDEALVAYLEAWKLERRYDIAANLGKLELELGRSRDAAEHLNYALTHLPADVDPKTRALLEASMQAARAKVASVRVELEPKAQHLLVDGQKAELLPGVTEIFVDPGPRAFEGRLDGYEPMEQKLETSAGGSYTVRFVLKPSTTLNSARVGVVGSDPAPPAQPVTREEPSSSGSRSKLPLFIGGGLALAAIGAGVGFTLAANDTESNRELLLDDLETATQPKSVRSHTSEHPPRCAAAAGLLEDEQRFRNLAVGAFVVGGVAAAATIAYWLFWPEPKKAGTGMLLVPVTGSNGSRGVSLSATF